MMKIGSFLTSAHLSDVLYWGAAPHPPTPPGQEENTSSSSLKGRCQRPCHTRTDECDVELLYRVFEGFSADLLSDHPNGSRESLADAWIHQDHAGAWMEKNLP